jgi:hypothetical protein
MTNDESERVLAWLENTAGSSSTTCPFLTVPSIVSTAHSLTRTCVRDMLLVNFFLPQASAHCLCQRYNTLEGMRQGS